MKMLVLLPRPAGTRLFPPDLLLGPHERLHRLGNRFRPRHPALLTAAGSPTAPGRAVLYLGGRGLAAPPPERLELYLDTDLHTRGDADDVAPHAVEHVAELLEGFALVLLLGVLLRVAARVHM